MTSSNWNDENGVSSCMMANSLVAPLYDLNSWKPVSLFRAGNRFQISIDVPEWMHDLCPVLWFSVFVTCALIGIYVTLLMDSGFWTTQYYRSSIEAQATKRVGRTCTRQKRTIEHFYPHQQHLVHSKDYVVAQHCPELPQWPFFSNETVQVTCQRAWLLSSAPRVNSLAP